MSLLALYSVLCLVSSTGCVFAIARLNQTTNRLLEECQMMRTARSADSQCPLQGKVVVKGGGE